jgi:glycosyltransferase involved in cell wall biosynthesis
LKSLILFNKSPFPATDGGTMAAFSLAEAVMASSDFTVLVPFSTNKHRVDDALKPSHWKSKSILEPVEADTRIKPVRMLKSMADGSSYHMQRVRDSETRNKVLHIIQKHRPDIIVLDGLFGLAYAEIIKSAYDIPLLYRSHNVEHKIWEELALREKNPIKRGTLSILAGRLKSEEWDMLRFTDGVFFISDRDAAYFQEMGLRKPLEVLFPSFGDSFFQRSFSPSPVSQTLHLFHLGAMDWAPNVEAVDYFLAKILPALRAEFGHRVRFHAAGRYMPAHLLRVKEEGFSCSGSVPDFMDFASGFHAMAVPLLSGSGIRMKIAEAMVSGIPVLASEPAMRGIPARNKKEFLLADKPKDWIKVVGSIFEGQHDLAELSVCARKKASALFSSQSSEKTVRQLFDRVKH